MNTPTPSDNAAARDRVLLVDDDRELCQMLTEYLEAEHFEVKSVHDGGEALTELKTHAFQLVILDVMLPTFSGFDVLRKLGASHETPILMLTARGDDVDRRRLSQQAFQSPGIGRAHSRDPTAREQPQRA
jgi:two-component system response regulator CpxR